ncbi:MAG: hypothetical protein GY694_07400 [Gammaproteobacteria bacterium]|nr:hypothetical protein [Gammaproteobacteria bacterium]
MTGMSGTITPVYQIIDFSNLTIDQVSRIYRMVSSSGNECFFIQNHVSTLIKNYDAKSKVGEL